MNRNLIYIKEELKHAVRSEVILRPDYTIFNRRIDRWDWFWYSINLSLERDRPSDDRMQPETQTLRITTWFDSIEYTSDDISFSKVCMLADFLISNMQEGHMHNNVIPF